MKISRQLAGLLEAFTVVTLLLASVAVVMLQLNPNQPLGVDFAPLWAAAQSPAEAYDMLAITEAQSELYQIRLNLRPFAYPPTALLFLLPLGGLPFYVAYCTFVLSSFSVFVWAAVRAGSPWWTALFPPVVVLVHIGQVTLLIGGFALLALTLKDWRCRGLLLGIAVAVKPQLFLFMPLALIVQRDWRSLSAAVAVICLLAMGATLTFGPRVWSWWISSTGDLLQVVQSSPTLSANMLHGDPVVFVIPAILLVWFTRNGRAATRFAAIIGAALLVSPYAMNYELAMLAPAIAAASQVTPLMYIPVLLLGLGFFGIEMTVLLLTLIALLLYSSREQFLAFWKARNFTVERG